VPGWPTYTAVLLLSGSHSWETSHNSSIGSLGLLYVAVQLGTLFRTQRPKPGMIQFAAAFLEAAQRLARGVCVIAAWIFAAVLFDAMFASGRGSCAQKHFVTSGRGVVLSLHAVGLLCSEVRPRTVAFLDDGVRPLCLTVHARISRLLREVPLLVKRWAQSETCAAEVVTLRRTCVVVLPGFALLHHYLGRCFTDAPVMWISGLGLVSLMASVVVKWRGLHDGCTLAYCVTCCKSASIGVLWVREVMRRGARCSHRSVDRV